MRKSNFFKGFFLAVGLSCLVCFTYMHSTKMGLARKIETNMENTLYLDLKDGRVVIRMLPDVAPKHVARIKELVRSGFYC